MLSMKDMARSPEDLKKDRDIPMPVAAKAIGPAYPWGLSLCLNDESLDKLGIDGDLPDVGDVIHIAALCRVTCASETENATEDGGKETCRRIELQVTHMAAEDEDRETESRGKRWYQPEAEPNGE
jgi:hypothetical protein